MISKILEFLSGHKCYWGVPVKVSNKLITVTCYECSKVKELKYREDF